MINLTLFSDSSSGLSALGVDPKAFVVQLVTFVLAFLVLKRYAFKPIIKLLRERRETIERGVKLGEQMQKEKEELERRVEQALHEARIQADEIIAGARDSAKQSIEEAEAKAKAKAEGLLASAEERIKQEAAQARKKLEGEVVNLVAEATETVIHEKLDAKKDAELIKRAIKAKQVA